MFFLCYLRYSISLFISKLQSISEPWQPPINTTGSHHGLSPWVFVLGASRSWTQRRKQGLDVQKDKDIKSTSIYINHHQLTSTWVTPPGEWWLSRTDSGT